MNDLIEWRADILNALGQPTRLKIVECLREGERSVSDISTTIGEEQYPIHRHLNLMLAAGILSRSREGMNIFYAIKHPEVLAIADLAAEMMVREAGLPLPWQEET